jgi:hypothetical protein
MIIFFDLEFEIERNEERGSSNLKEITDRADEPPTL